MKYVLDIGYDYDPLDRIAQEIRILWVQNESASDTTPLRCRLEHISLLKDPIRPYMGISYVWGDHTRRKAAIIDGRQVSVTETADSALRGCLNNEPDDELKRFDTENEQPTWDFEVPFWIDAICIDQTNLRERSEQVKIMGTIYSSAYEVAIWLGDDSDGMARRAKSVLGDLESYFFKIRRQMMSITQITAETFENLEDEDWRALDSVYSSPWFTRIWTLQEAVLNGRVTCRKGSYLLGWDFIPMLAATYCRGTRLRNLAFNTLSVSGDRGLACATTFMLILHQRRLSKLLTGTSQSNSTDPRDKVYGLMGLLETDAIDEIVVDYDRSIEDVHTSASRAAISQDRSLDVLCEAFFRVPPVGGPPQQLYPSWVIPCHWPRATFANTAPQNESPIELRGLFEYSDSGPPNVLRIRGLVLDEIAHVSHEIFGGASTVSYQQAAAIRCLTEVVNTVLNFTGDGPSPVKGMSLSDLLGRLIPADQHDSSPPPELELFEKLIQLHHGLPHLIHGEKKDAVAVLDSKYDGTLAEMWVANRGRRLTTTTNHRLANTWPSAKKGDKICLLFGCDTLLILRQDEDHWLLIGDAQLPGLMQGEDMFELRDKGELDEKIQWFDIH